jgi:transposase
MPKEATGNYHRPIAWRLIEAGFDVRLASSMALARTREALHNGWDKNDPRDAQVNGQGKGRPLCRHNGEAGTRRSHFLLTICEMTAAPPWS